MNSDGKSAVFCISVISVALVALIYTVHMDSWNHKVFTFLPDTQMIVNGTAVMDIQWRWLPETLEMEVKVNDDNNETPHTYYGCDYLGLLFDSDHNGKLAKDFVEANTENDHGVFLYQDNQSYVLDHCFILLPDSSMPGYWMNNSVVYSRLYGEKNLNDTCCVFRENEGYTFKLTIPTEFINVRSPTLIHISFWDSEIIYLSPPYNYIYSQYDTIASDFWV